ncbi:MAG: class I SAM-dependent methyltransferase [Firmicutes bacterium]|nr:class I SAM-dependent methyltransferase [Bacillota bacterium]
MDNITEVIKRRYNRTAMFYDWMDFMISDSVRKDALSMAKGKVLEVGVGTGKNLSLYPSRCKITGIDFSKEMLKRARDKAKKLNLSVELLEMDAQKMDFDDNTFDTVVSTCVFCSVPDPVKGLEEVKRVCKPNGQIILLEHVRSANPAIGKVMDFLNPITLKMVGSNINRETVGNVNKAGISLKEVADVGKTKILKLIIAEPEGFKEQKCH